MIWRCRNSCDEIYYPFFLYILTRYTFLYSKCVNIVVLFTSFIFILTGKNANKEIMNILWPIMGRSSLVHCKYCSLLYIINGILCFKTNQKPKFGRDVMTYTPLISKLLVPMIMMIPSPFNKSCFLNEGLWKKWTNNW